MTADLVGDRWTLVVVRDMLTGKKHFADFLASPERISTSILCDRLAFMEGIGLVEKKAYLDRPIRFEYTLTDKGLGLLPVLQEASRWANRFLPETVTLPEDFMIRRPR